MTREEMIVEAKRTFLSFQIDEVLPLEKYQVMIKPEFTTASWRFYEGRHIIVIGEDIFENMQEKSDYLGECEYLNAFLIHEFAHSIWSERDIEKSNHILRKELLPFQLYNLFEDVRIEEKMRLKRKKYFNWFHYESVRTPQNPMMMLFYMMQCEHRHADLKRLQKSLPSQQHYDLQQVFSFYKEIIKIEKSHDLIEVMKRWIIEFPSTLVDIESFSTLNNEFSEVTSEDIKEYLFMNEADYIIDTEAFSSLIEGLEDVLENDTKESNPNIPRLHIKKKSKLLAKTPLPIPFKQKKANLLYKKMQELFFASSRYQATEIPSKRLNLKRVAQGSEKIFKRREMIRIDKKCISIILDISGSMYRTMEDMRLLIHVIDTLVQAGVIEANLILSAVDGRTSLSELIPMPLEKGILECIIADYEGEGISDTMDTHQKLLQKSDYVWIFTDGHIGGGLRAKKHYHNLGIKTHAMYVGNDTSSTKKKMREWFDYIICRKDIEGLANDVLRLIKF